MLMDRDKAILRFIEDYGGITIGICSKVFYKGHKYGYDEARKRLKILKTMVKLNSYKNSVTNELIYGRGKVISPHRVFVLDYYANLINIGCEIIEFAIEPKFMDGKYYGDGYFVYKFLDNIYLNVLEVDLTHLCNLKKYEEIYSCGEIQERYKDWGDNIFPQIVVMRGNMEGRKYNTDNFKVIYLDYKMIDFVNSVLA